jgi:hypothetical protein
VPKQIDDLEHHKVNEVTKKSPSALQKTMRGINVVAGRSLQAPTSKKRRTSATGV